MTKKLRGKTLNIEVLNPQGNQSGVKSVTVNGVKPDGSFISDELLKDTNEIIIEM
jgi:cellobiose phosphorylase